MEPPDFHDPVSRDGHRVADHVVIALGLDHADEAFIFFEDIADCAALDRGGEFVIFSNVAPAGRGGRVLPADFDEFLEWVDRRCGHKNCSTSRLRFVRTRWQLAHTMSHLAISSMIAFSDNL